MTAPQSIELQTLVETCAELLRVGEFQDYCPNGLQVEGASQVRRLVTGVTASQALIDAAAATGAEALLVHHGVFWTGDDPCLVGPRGRRVRALHAAGMSLLAYHLPLDAHVQLGNNAQLAVRLGILDAQPVSAEQPLLWRGRLAEPRPAAQWAEQIARALGRIPTHVAAGDRPIQTLAWCSGGGQRYLEQAGALGVDAYLSGEISESTTHLAREWGVDYFALGHHASERDGVRALGIHLAERFGLEQQFIDIANPA